MDKNKFTRRSGDDNLVFFPSSWENTSLNEGRVQKREKFSSDGLPHDPLEDLLEEFAEYEDMEREIESLGMSFVKLKEESEALADFKGRDLVFEQLKLLSQINERMNYLLNEIKLYQL